MKKICLFLFLVLLVGLSGKGYGLASNDFAQAAPPNSSDPINATLAEKPADTGVIAAAVVTGNTAFAFDLYAQLKSKEGNLFLSPYSISTALAMTWAGARGQTEQQMAKTLHFPQPQEPFHKAYGHLIQLFNTQGQKGDYQLSVANALWLQKDYQFLPEFLGVASAHYDASLQQVDYVNETEKSRQTINDWTARRTQDKIKDLIPQGALNALTRLVLTNAIYFKGDWALKFDVDQTREAPFSVSADKRVNVPLMHQKEKFKYGQTETHQMLELPYKGEALSMLVLLPKTIDGLPALEKDLTADRLTQWQQQMRKQEVLVYLPKFKVASQFGLNQTLSAMGMPDAFGDTADFSGMNGAKNLYISDVIHKAFVEVNEEGTEAAAATGVIVAVMSLAPPPPVFRADRPFVFLIKDNATGSILFMGRVADPTQE